MNVVLTGNHAYNMYMNSEVILRLVEPYEYSTFCTRFSDRKPAETVNRFFIN